jgi:hypothetical protein
MQYKVGRQCSRSSEGFPAPVVVVKARQVREFARATGRLAKTDEINQFELISAGGFKQHTLGRGFLQYRYRSRDPARCIRYASRFRLGRNGTSNRAFDTSTPTTPFPSICSLQLFTASP